MLGLPDGDIGLERIDEPLARRERLSSVRACHAYDDARLGGWHRPEAVPYKDAHSAPPLNRLGGEAGQFGLGHRPVGLVREQVRLALVRPPPARADEDGNTTGPLVCQEIVHRGEVERRLGESGPECAGRGASHRA